MLNKEIRTAIFREDKIYKKHIKYEMHLKYISISPK